MYLFLIILIIGLICAFPELSSGTLYNCGTIDKNIIKKLLNNKLPIVLYFMHVSFLHCKVICMTFKHM